MWMKCFFYVSCDSPTFQVPMRRKTLMMSRMRLSAARMVLMIIRSELPLAIRVPDPPRPRRPMSWGGKISSIFDVSFCHRNSYNAKPTDDEAPIS